MLCKDAAMPPAADVPQPAPPPHPEGAPGGQAEASGQPPAVPWFEAAGTFACEVRVRYAECDPMGIAHHATYPIWLEIGRTEMLRASGVSYAELEAGGVFLVVAKLDLRYRRPVRYDDLLTVEVSTGGVAPGGPAVKLEHTYRLLRGRELCATASTLLVSVDAEGRMKPLR